MKSCLSNTYNKKNAVTVRPVRSAVDAVPRMRSGVLNLNVPLPLLHYVANSVAVLHHLGGHCVLKNKTIKFLKKILNC